MSLPFVYVRSEAKKHGMTNMIEGVIEPGQSVVVIEDLISTGGSSLKAVQALRDAGCNVKGMVAIFTYGFKEAVDNFKQANCPLITLSNYHILIEKLSIYNFDKVNRDLLFNCIQSSFGKLSFDVDVVSLISSSSVWTSSQDKQLKSWFAQFLNWMQTSKNGTAELKATNNHGIWFDAQRLSFALYTNNKKNANEVIESAKQRLEKQMNAAGLFPAELARTTSLHYSLFAVEAFLKVAQLSTNAGIDYWSFTASNGNSLQKACDTLLPYLIQQKKWTGEQIKPFNYDEAIPFFAAVANKKNCQNCIDKLAQNNSYKILQSIY
jgi:hypothetical protein